MNLIAVGVDASKGYADFCFQNDAGSVLPPSRRYDDTPDGHAAVRRAVTELAARHPHARFRIGVECSGGLERNWLRLFASLPSCDLYRLSPLAVHRFLERDLHRNVTDPLSAKGIAAYLREGLRRADVPYEPDLEGALTLYRLVTNLIDRATQVKNELQSLLPAVHPDLVQFTRQGLPQWVLRLLGQTPTVETLARADAQTLARIPYLTRARAHSLITAAKRSVAALREPATATVVTVLAEEALRLDQKVAELKRELGRQLEHEPVIQLLVSIPGIGLWTAVCLRLEFGRFERFHSGAALVAYAGLDPRVHQSGDGTTHIGISRRGRREIRAALYMAVLTATQNNPPIAAFYARLTQRGKTHAQAACACMAKLLHIIYACVKHGERFDPQRHHQVAAREAPPATATPGGAAAEDAAVGALTAPVSRREAQRRRAAAAPQTAVSRRIRGRGAAEDHDSTSRGTCQGSRAPGPATP